MNLVDLFSLLFYRFMAERMLVDGKKVWQTAHKNLVCWLESESLAGNERFALIERQKILDNYASEEIRNIMTASVERGQHLLSLPPFAGVLSEVEREKIWSELQKSELIE